MNCIRLSVAGWFLLTTVAHADVGSRLLATGGITGFEGAGGGGITPWAFISGYGSREEINGTANVQLLNLGEYSMTTYGLSAGFFDRFELGIQRQKLDVSSGITSNVFSLLTDGVITTAPSTSIEQDVFTLKVRLAGDGVYDQNSWLPQLAMGAHYKKNRNFNDTLLTSTGDGPLPGQGVPRILGAKSKDGTDVFLSATKLFLGWPHGYNLLANVTARYTRANVFGLLGFGREGDNGYSLEWESSIAILPTPNTAIGIEIRTQSNRLNGLAKEDTVSDFFIAWFPSKSYSLTAAYVDLGNLPFQPDSSGFYLTFSANY